MSTSSPTYPTTQREHSVHPAHLQASSVDKLCHQESRWCEDIHSGGNPRTTTPTGYEPKELATVSRIEAYSGDPFQFYERLGRLACRILNYKRRPASNRRCTSTSLWKALQTLISKLKKVLTSPLYAQKASGKPDAMVMQEREVSAQNTQANRKESLRSHSSVCPESFGETWCIVFI